LLIAVSVNQGMHAASKPSAAFKRRMFTPSAKGK